MKIAIHQRENSFSQDWISHCEQKKIKYKIVNCYDNDIIFQLQDCDALMWHFHQNNPKNILFAKQLIYSLEAAGKKVFPDFHTVWHFDDKVGQKYLLDAVGAPLVPGTIFYCKREAIKWAATCEYPKVFKLRCGAGSQNVKLVSNKHQAIRLIRQAFGSGFSSYDPIANLKERWRLFRLGRTTLRDVIEGLVRFVIPPPYARLKGPEKGYIYFQNYIPGNDHDIRVIVIGDKAFAIKRMVREGDFRASGSGNIKYNRNLFDDNTVKLSFDLARKLQAQCVAFDFIHDLGKPMVLEISYGFTPGAYNQCPGYWDTDLNWHEEAFNWHGWMVDNLIQSITKRDNKLLDNK